MSHALIDGSRDLEHVTLLPKLAQVINLVGWPKLVNLCFFFFFLGQATRSESSQEHPPMAGETATSNVRTFFSYFN